VKNVKRCRKMSKNVKRWNVESHHEKRRKTSRKTSKDVMKNIKRCHEKRREKHRKTSWKTSKIRSFVSKLKTDNYLFFERRLTEPVFSSPILAKYHKSFYTCNLQCNDRHFHPSLIFAGGARSLPMVWRPIRWPFIRMLITIVKKVLLVDYNSKKFYSPGIRSELHCYKYFPDCNLWFFIVS
jgi:hypothetical protein